MFEHESSEATWRIIPGLVSVVRVTPIYKPFRPFRRETTLLMRLTNHGYLPRINWDDPPSSSHIWGVVSLDKIPGVWVLQDKKGYWLDVTSPPRMMQSSPLKMT